MYIDTNNIAYKFYSIFLFYILCGRITVTLLSKLLMITPPPELAVILLFGTIILILKTKKIYSYDILICFVFYLSGFLNIAYSYDYSNSYISYYSEAAYLFGLFTIIPILFLVGKIKLEGDQDLKFSSRLQKKILFGHILNLIMIFLIVDTSLYSFFKDVSYAYLSEAFAISFIFYYSSVENNKYKIFGTIFYLILMIIIPSRSIFFTSIIYVLIQSKFSSILKIFLSSIILISVFILFVEEDSFGIYDMSSRLLKISLNDNSLDERSLLFDLNFKQLTENIFTGKFSGSSLHNGNTGMYFHNILYVIHYYGLIPFLIVIIWIVISILRKSVRAKSLLFISLFLSFFFRGPSFFLLFFIIGLFNENNISNNSTSSLRY